MAWEIPRTAINPMVAIAEVSKPHLKPYVDYMLRPVLEEQQELGSIFTDIFSAISKGTSWLYRQIKEHPEISIPTITVGVGMATSPTFRKNAKYIVPALGVYTLGYYLYKYKNKPQEAIQVGVGDAAKEEKLQKIAKEVTAYVRETPKESTAFFSDLGNLIKDVGVAAATILMAKKINDMVKQKAAQTGQNPQTTYEKAAAYVAAHRDEFAAMGYTSPEEAIAALLYATGGMAPDVDTDPRQALFGTQLVKPTGISELISKYWWVGALGVLFVVAYRRR